MATGEPMRLVAIVLLMCAMLPAAAEVRVEGVRMWPSPERTRVVLDLSGPTPHRLFTLEGPDRVVVDLRDTRLGEPLPPPASDDPALAGLRSGTRDNGDLRVVLDLNGPVRPKSFLLRPNDTYGHRLVVDLYTGNTRTPTAADRRAAGELRKVIIAVDAGHGGEDPGAIGRGGTREKDVVLAIARELVALLEAERGMHGVLTRTGDYFLRLRKRVEIAREHEADFFVSLHADAFRDARVGGASVYALSQRGATSEAARWLARRENASDLVGGVSLDDKDDLLASVLLDLSQTATIEASIGAGDAILESLGGLGELHKARVQQAGFAVLKAPDIPSLLVETGFISNPSEERRLRNPRHQRRIAAAIMDGLRGHFRAHPPPGTVLAAREHVISRGDTLSELADQYDVSLETLRAVNRLRGDMLEVGQVLHIPPPAGSGAWAVARGG